MEYEDCSYQYETATDRVQEIQGENPYQNNDEQIPSAPEPQTAALSTDKKKSKSLIFASAVAVTLFVLLGLVVGGLFFVSQEKQRLDEAKKMYEAGVAELERKNQEFNETIMEKIFKLSELERMNQEFNETIMEKIFKLSESSQEQKNKQNKTNLDIQRQIHDIEMKQKSKLNQTKLELERLIHANEVKQNKTQVQLFKGARSCAELRDKYGILKTGIYEMKFNDSYFPVYSNCDFKLRTGKFVCDNLLKEMGTDFSPGYFWIRENASAQPNFKFCKGPSSCKELLQKTGKSSGQISNIYPTSLFERKKVYCDHDGWTVFQRRKDGSVDFFRNWDDYVNGFGDMNGEFWLGLETIYQLTKHGVYELRVDLEDFYGNKAYAQYGRFFIFSASDKYRLSVSFYSGNAGDSLAIQNGKRFTTKDNDFDEDGGNCANKYKGGWWYKKCHLSNLNGKYYSSVGTGAEGVGWYHWKNAHQYLKFTEMKFRKKN